MTIDLNNLIQSIQEDLLIVNAAIAALPSSTDIATDLQNARDLLEAVTLKAKDFLATISTLLNLGLLDFGEQFFTTLETGLENAGNTVISETASIGNTIFSKLEDLVEDAKELPDTAVTGLSNIGSTAASKLGDLAENAQSLPGTIKTKTLNLKQSIAEKLDDIVD